MENTSVETPDSGLVDTIGRRLAELQDRIAAAAATSGRPAGDIALLAVTKTHPASTVMAAYQCGLRSFGENYVQEALAKQDSLAGFADGAAWHFIGHLQTNKSKMIAGRFHLIHGVGSERLGARIARDASALGTVQDVLIQLKLGDEESKSGVDADDAVRLGETLAQMPGIRVAGLMAMAPLSENGNPVTDPRRYFAEARRVFEQFPSEQRTILSMGMSGDFEAAIAEGSNLIRVGSSLFGHRPVSG